jgi:hypothetical protein
MRSGTSISTETSSEVTFYTICNAPYFLGLVGLINSLRLLGHTDPIVVLDCGLTPEQRRLLSPHCTLFKLPNDVAQNPQQYKAFPYLLNPQGTIAIIDSDIIVTRCLKTILRSAEQGKICVFSDPENYRWFSEWAGCLTHLRRPLISRRRLCQKALPIKPSGSKLGTMGCSSEATCFQGF